MNYTSGTTGRPKGVRRALPGTEPEAGGRGFGGMLTMFGLQPFDDNVHIVGSPLYHTAVLVFAGSAIHSGPHGRRHGQVDARADAAPHRHATRSRTPTWCRRSSCACSGSPKRRTRQVRRVVAAPHGARGGAVPARREASDDRVVGSGDRRVLRRERRRRHARVREGVARAPRHGRARRGRASEIVILDDDDNELPADEIGTVYMHMMAGSFEYYKDKDKTEKSRRGKFFTVGDVGFLDDDGWLFLSDRKTDMIISGGANIYPAEIESELIMHPKVADVAVFGIPHDDWGEEVKAVVEPVEGVDRQPRARSRDPRVGGRHDSPSSRRRARSTSPTSCRATRTASSTSASSATRTGKAASAPSDALASGRSAMETRNRAVRPDREGRGGDRREPGNRTRRRRGAGHRGRRRRDRQPQARQLPDRRRRDRARDGPPGAAGRVPRRNLGRRRPARRHRVRRVRPLRRPRQQRGHVAAVSRTSYRSPRSSTTRRMR